MIIQIDNYKFIEDKGYFKITLDNNDKLLLTRKEFSNMQLLDFQRYLMFESTSGKFYKPISANNIVCFEEL